jgi:hypothetical protein
MVNVCLNVAPPCHTLQCFTGTAHFDVRHWGPPRSQSALQPSALRGPTWHLQYNPAAMPVHNAHGDACVRVACLLAAVTPSSYLSQSQVPLPMLITLGFRPWTCALDSVSIPHVGSLGPFEAEACMSPLNMYFVVALQLRPKLAAITAAERKLPLGTFIQGLPFAVPRALARW